MAGTCVKWTAIVLTTANKDWTYAFQKGTVVSRNHLWQKKFLRFLVILKIIETYSILIR